VKQVGYYNGAIGELSEMTVPMSDRAVYFGDGVYDAAMVVNRIPFDFEDHIDRFYSSLRLLEIANFGMERDELRSELLKCLDYSDSENAMLYWQADRGTFPRRHNYPPEDVKANLLITVTPKQIPDTEKLVKLVTVDDVRFRLCNIKTLNLIPNVMANQHASAGGYDEAVFVRDGIVTEGSHTNVSIIEGGKVITHPLDSGILPGITRKRMITVAEQSGIPVIERKFTVEEMLDADEVFISGSTSFLKCASSIDGKPVGGKARGVFETLRTGFLNEVALQCGDM